MPKELISYICKINNFVILIMISVFRGWSILVKNIITFLSCNYLMKKKFIYFYSVFFKFGVFFNSIMGLLQNFSYFFKIRGMGFKASILNSILILKVGFSHNLLYHVENVIQIIFKNKQFFIIRSRCFFSLLRLVYFFKELNKRNCYKKKGIFFKGFFFSHKLSNKKSKF